MCARRADRRLRVLAPVLAAVALAGCATTPGPRERLLPAEQVVHTSRGGWLEVRRPRGERYVVDGELLAVHGDTLHVLAVDGPRAIVPEADWELRLICGDNEATDVAMRTAVSSLLCLTNGFFLVFTMPLTWVAGATESQDRADVGVIEPGVGALDRLRPCARFPQGLPPGMDLSRLTLLKRKVLSASRRHVP